MLKNDKKGLRARLDDIYKWSVKSGVAVATPNSLKVQWDKVIEELNELLFNCYHANTEKLVDDIGDSFIAFINLLNMSSKKSGIFEQNKGRMDTIASTILRANELVKFNCTIGSMSYIGVIFKALKEAHYLKHKEELNDDELYKFSLKLIGVYRIVKLIYDIKVSLRDCIYSSYREIQGRQYEIRVR